jgi:hypothetical protein
MPDRQQSPTEAPPALTLAGFADPVVVRLGHQLGSSYVELTRSTRMLAPSQCLVLSGIGTSWR